MTVIKNGKVVRIEGGYSRVDIGGRIILCDLKKKLLKRHKNVTTSIVVGDNVSIELVEEFHGIIVEVQPRKNKLSRCSPGSTTSEDIIAVNIDTMFTVQSFRLPKLNLGLLDRFLVIAEREGINSVICINKIDLMQSPREKENVLFYDTIGYRVVFTSASRNEGIEELKSLLKNKTTIFTGASGVGKSSLLNCIQPGLKLKTGDISSATWKGKHTTTGISLLELEIGGYVIDTPGLRELGLWNVSRKELPGLFPEFREYETRCKFRDCSHLHEPGCVIRENLAKGGIHQQRYLRYQQFYYSLPD